MKGKAANGIRSTFGLSVPSFLFPVYLEHLSILDSAGRTSQDWNFAAADHAIRTWTLLPASSSNSTLWGSLALACTGTQHAAELLRRLRTQGKTKPAFEPRRLEFVLVTHAPQERGSHRTPRVAGGWEMDRAGSIRPLTASDSREASPPFLFRKPHLGAGNGGWLLLGYGARFQTAPATDTFDFDDPQHRLKRFASLFSPEAQLTNPVAFLERLHFKGVRYQRPRSLNFLRVLNRHLSPWLEVSPTAWISKEHEFGPWWKSLAPWRQSLATVLLDVARHVLDATVKLPDPYQQTGLMLVDGLEHWCPPDCQPQFLSLLGDLFPRLQFILRLPEALRKLVPASLLAATQPIPKPGIRPRKATVAHAGVGAVLLVDVDSSLPNLALMKLSRHFKEQGKRVLLARGAALVPKASAVFASCVFAFPSSAQRVEKLRRFYGPDLQIGGSGVDILRRLAPEIENLPPDYSLYPEMGDRALGFLTRGCPLHCPFCIVPIKEGKPRLVSDFETLLQGRQKLILLDDNILSHSAAVGLMEEMLRRDLAVNFNQTLDLRLLTPTTASLLRRIRCSNVSFSRRNYYFSLNNVRALELMRQRYGLLEVNFRDNVAFVCMYGFDTTLAQDVERFRFLRSLPGAYVFVQRYRPVLGGPEADLSAFFDENADENIDALLTVNFTQNMKSMEVYYRWLCLLYAQQCGRTHRRLVETLFRYNGRQRMGGFLTKLHALAAARGQAVDRSASLICG